MDCDLNMVVATQYFQKELFTYDFRPQLEKSECPILLLHGDRNAVHSLASADITAKAIPAEFLTRHYLKGAATPVYDADPELVREQMRAFCAKAAALRELKSFRCGL